MSDQSSSATRLFAVGSDDLHGFSIVDELDFSVRQKACSLSNPLWDGDLAFGSNAHLRRPYSYW
jgi:hypothetical protein